MPRPRKPRIPKKIFVAIRSLDYAVLSTGPDKKAVVAQATEAAGPGAKVTLYTYVHESQVMKERLRQFN